MGMIGNYFMTGRENIDAILRGEISVEDLIYDENDEIDEECALDIDKAWHAIHFVLTGEVAGGDGILAKVVLGSPRINEDDIGYGPAQWLTADEVAEAAAALEDVTKNDFWDFCPIQDFFDNDIYPVTENEDEEEFFEYIWAYFIDLREFFKKAAAERKCILFYID